MRSRRLPSPAPAAVAGEVVDILSARADPARAESSQRFFKEPVPLYGLPAAEQRELARDLVRRLRPVWRCGKAVDLANALIQEAELEAKAVGLLVLAAWSDEFPVSLLPRIHGWLAWNCGNWATVDLLAPDILGPLLDDHPELIPVVEDWTGSNCLWVRRGAAVAFVRHARKGRHLAAAYRIARSLLGDGEDLIHKAVGWLLRECGRTDRPRLERFLLEHGRDMARTSVRYAIEHFPEKERRHLLVATRP